MNTECDICTAEATLDFIEFRSLAVDDANINHVIEFCALHDLYILVGGGVSFFFFSFLFFFFPFYVLNIRLYMCFARCASLWKWRL